MEQNNVDEVKLPHSEKLPETLITDPKDASDIAKLTEKIMIKTPYGGEAPYVSIFFNQYVSEPKMWATILKKGPLEKERLETIGALFDDNKVIEDIREVDQAMKDVVPRPPRGQNIVLFSFQSLVVEFLVNKLLDSSQENWGNVISEWKKEWSSTMNPNKFEKVMRAVGYRDQAVDFLTALFQNMENKNSNPLLIKEADVKNRELASEEIQFSREALCHNTSLATLPKIIDRGLLSLEAAALARDGGNEAHFGVSFWAYNNNPPDSITDFAKDIRQGLDTYRAIDDKVHLVFLNPLQYIDSSCVLYPPYSHRTYRMDNKLDKPVNIANKYMEGADTDYDPEERRLAAYTLMGLPSPALSLVVLDKKLADSYKEKAGNFPFYLPAYSYEGELLFTPKDYDRLRSVKANNK